MKNENLWKMIIGGIMMLAGIAGGVLIAIFTHDTGFASVSIVAGALGGYAIIR